MPHVPSRHTKPIPVLVDNSLNRAIAIKYVIYSLFGLAGVLTTIPSITQLAGEVSAVILAAIVMVTSIAAAVAAWNSARNAQWEKVEIFTTITMVCFIGVYNFALVYLSLGGDLDRVNVAVISSALLVIPIWRIRYLIKKNRK